LRYVLESSPEAVDAFILDLPCRKIPGIGINIFFFLPYSTRIPRLGNIQMKFLAQGFENVKKIFYAPNAQNILQKGLNFFFQKVYCFSLNTFFTSKCKTMIKKCANFTSYIASSRHLKILPWKNLKKSKF
jgi:hypothetical protein